MPFTTSNGSAIHSPASTKRLNSQRRAVQGPIYGLHNRSINSQSLVTGVGINKNINNSLGSQINSPSGNLSASPFRPNLEAGIVTKKVHITLSISAEAFAAAARQNGSNKNNTPYNSSGHRNPSAVANM